MKNFIFGALLALMLSACSSAGGSPATVYTVAGEASLAAGDPIPLPSGEPVLTVSGEIGAANSGETIVMDMATVESAGLVEYSVMDPFLERQITFRGPLMSDLLDLWQVPDSATTLVIVALNDYAVDVPISLLREFPVIFAIQADGEYMQVADRGPAMLVFPYDHFEFERPATDAFWIWQIKSIEVE